MKFYNLKSRIYIFYDFHGEGGPRTIDPLYSFK